MEKIRVILVLGEADVDDITSGSTVLQGKDASNLWVNVDEDNDNDLGELEESLYGKLITLFPENGDDAENPFG